ncbi:hypothetical protein ACN38_g2960 [Penicillium nordicum]|uniref:Uncharacterized protein n=1 Tax=Penicillium nordicum TaxID=229535 RepID=A0A0M9WIG3_9EURO|nr:hypothetical protein ACN38_g2960 [Penicillium nordicum]
MGLARSLNSSPSPRTKGVDWRLIIEGSLVHFFLNFLPCEYLIPVCCSLIYSFAPLFLLRASHSFTLSQGLSLIHTLVAHSLFYSSLYLIPNIPSEDSQQKSSESPLFTDFRRNALDRIYISRTHFLHA